MEQVRRGEGGGAGEGERGEGCREGEGMGAEEEEEGGEGPEMTAEGGVEGAGRGGGAGAGGSGEGGRVSEGSGSKSDQRREGGGGVGGGDMGDTAPDPKKAGGGLAASPELEGCNGRAKGMRAKVGKKIGMKKSVAPKRVWSRGMSKEIVGDLHESANTTLGNTILFRRMRKGGGLANAMSGAVRRDRVVKELATTVRVEACDMTAKVKGRLLSPANDERGGVRLGTEGIDCGKARVVIDKKEKVTMTLTRGNGRGTPEVHMHKIKGFGGGRRGRGMRRLGELGLNTRGAWRSGRGG
ncbi:unnamed protein product [Closterium sp. NIES-64]|nr:unnamed protein product [Closterium sp. NIES-64]